MLRYPVQQIFSTTVTGTNSFTTNFFLPSFDIDNLIGKLVASSFNLGGNPGSPTLDVYLQTSDDGGTTFYDMAHFDQIAATVSKATARWCSIPLVSTNGTWIGNVAASSISGSTTSGLPPMGTIQRMAVNYGAANTQLIANWTITIYANTVSRNA